MSNELSSSHALSDSLPQPCPGNAWIEAVLGVLVGLAGWYMLGFSHVLNPHQIGWLLQFSDKDWYYDPTTYFLGWNYFRHSPWTFPPGLNPSYGMEFGSSIVYSDSTPLPAVLLKPFSPLLGSIFQYTGLWILSCFVLQGVLGVKLASTIVCRNVSKLIIAAFFVLSPVLIERAWTEYAHMGHWVLLWAIYLALRTGNRKIRWIWLAPAALAVGTSFYLVPMVVSLWVADGIRRAVRNWPALPWLALEGFALMLSVLATMWLFGYFAISVHNASTDDFGKFSVNLLGPISSWGSSLFLRDQPRSPIWLGEGYCYLGLGIMLLGIMALLDLIRAPIRRAQLLQIAPLAVVMLGLAAFSLSNKISLGTRVYELPNPWGPLGSIFRASGRMVWPGFYGLWLAIFYLATRHLTARRAMLVLSAMLVVQLLDLSPCFVSMRERYTTPRSWQSPLTDPFWAEAMKSYRQITVVPTGFILPYAPLAYLGSMHGVPCNSASLARYPSAKILDAYSLAHDLALRENRPGPATLYIIPEPNRFNDLVQKLSKRHGTGKINGYYVVAPDWFTRPHPTPIADLQPGRGE